MFSGQREGIFVPKITQRNLGGNTPGSFDYLGNKGSGKLGGKSAGDN
jgi:hypothetical protein